MYSKDNVDITPDAVQQIWAELRSWVRNLFGQRSELSQEAKFVQRAQNYREIYLSVDSQNEGVPKIAKVVKEIVQEGEKEMIVAEYQNYQTPICQFMRLERTSANIPPFAQAIRCIKSGDTQHVEVIEDLDYFWPQLTGSLRSN